MRSLLIFCFSEYLNARDEEAWREAMEPNPQSQAMMIESINSLLSQPIHASPLLFSPPPPPLPEQTHSPLDPVLIEKVSSLEFSWETAVLQNDAHIINTNFVREMNKAIGFSRSNEKLRYEYTQRLRKETLRALQAIDIDTLCRFLTKQLATGKVKHGDWVEVDTNILNGCVFLFLRVYIISHLVPGAYFALTTLMASLLSPSFPQFRCNSSRTSSAPFVSFSMVSLLRQIQGC